MTSFDRLGFSPADILLPGKKTDMTKWSAVACDQYTSEPGYWQEAYRIAAGSPSTLDLVLPEAFLDEARSDEQTEAINANMRRYLNEDLFDLFRGVMIYVERTLKNGQIRRGLVGAVDLEQYEFTPGNSAMIRATEGTVADRLPPRMRIRRNAPMELPHVMLLCDDPGNTVIEPFAQMTDRLYKVYDFDLMQDSGHLRGWLIDRENLVPVREALWALADPEAQKARYGEGAGDPMVFAVGDGNHSLAAAKGCWEEIRDTLPPEERETHPARFALCELVNLHDRSLEFEAIHRVLFDCDPDKVLAAIKVYFPGAFEGRGDGQQFTFVTSSGETVITIPNAAAKLTVGSVQAFLDDYVSAKGGRVDYIHGDSVVRDLCRSEEACGFLLPAMSKNQLFPAVMYDGVLPRKTFSMGEACDKRFYLEGRKIVR